MSQLATQRGFTALRRFVRREEAHVRCDMCAAALSEAHEHLFEPKARQVSCACQACALLFPNEVGGRYRRLTRSVQRLHQAAISGADLEALGIPVRLVCLCPSAEHDRVFAMYPSPAGAIEADVSMPQWQDWLQQRPQITVANDLEALVIDARASESRIWRVSIDVCQRLLGQLRARPGRAGFLAFEAELRSLDGGRHV
jgi:hypothetical protein